ncbi:MAG: UvrD-helicase domain-containing protein [Defluviitaleaceae bacterium]|nr:UvrD-helicase domain-containing protein [Defluviitaleaceae bacterium]
MDSDSFNNTNISDGRDSNYDFNAENITEDDKRGERKYLALVGVILDGLIEKYEAASSKNREDLYETRKQILEELRLEYGDDEETVNMMTFDDLGNLASFDRFITESDKKYFNSVLLLNNLKRMKNAPFFGRMDFAEDGAGAPEKIYIGVNSLYDEKTFEFYVYDWRAPISSMFYDFGPGRAEFDAPDGKVSGELIKKRQYKISGGRMRYMFDSDLVIDDDILMYELSKPSAAAMKPVINSIQKAQNYAIRYDRFENLLIYGVAGSGKTTVGLHRLAFLLYKYRGAISSWDIRIFSNNNIFISYISDIIPELGEESIPMLDFGDVIETNMPRKFAYKDMYEQIEFLSDKAASDSPRARGIVLKYSKPFLNYAAEYVKTYKPKFYDIYFYDFLICEGRELEEQYKARTKRSDMRLKTERVIEFLGQRLGEFIEENKKDVTKRLNERFEEYVSPKSSARIFENFKANILAEITALANPDAVEIYKKLLGEYSDSPPEIFYETAGSLESELNFEDILVVLYLQVLKGDAPKNNGVKHILIDEAQDWNPLQHRIIRALFPNSKFTVLADVNQALYRAINILDKDELAEIYAEAAKKPAVIELEKSYRQTFEISRFASYILGIFSEDKYFKRHGEEPRIIETEPGGAADGIASLIGEINAKGYRSVGILTERKQEAEELYRRLRKKAGVALITDADAKFQTGAVIMPIAYAKGLEFDAVIVPGYGELAGEENKRILYLMCTRALHLLYLIK